MVILLTGLQLICTNQSDKISITTTKNQPTIAWQFLKQLNTELPYDQKILLIGIYPNKNKMLEAYNYLCAYLPPERLIMTKTCKGVKNKYKKI